MQTIDNYISELESKTRLIKDYSLNESLSKLIAIAIALSSGVKLSIKTTCEHEVVSAYGQAPYFNCKTSSIDNGVKTNIENLYKSINKLCNELNLIAPDRDIYPTQENEDCKYNKYLHKANRIKKEYESSNLK